MTNTAGLITAGLSLGVGMRLVGTLYAALHILVGSIVKGMKF